MPEPVQAGEPGPSLEERDRQLRWLLLLRVAAASAVLVATLYIQFLSGTRFAFRPLFWVVGLVFAASLLWALTHRRLVGWGPYAGVQLSVDVVLETLIIYFMGGFGSPFVVLYLLTVVVAGFMLSRRGATLIAGLTVICYGLVGLSVYVVNPLVGLLPQEFQEAFRAGLAGATVDATELYLRLFALLLVSYGVAWSSSAMATRLRQAASELRSRGSQLQALRELNERIVQDMASGLLVADLAGKVVTFNAAAEEITGRRARQMAGAPINEVFGTDSDLFRRVEQRLRADGTYRTELVIRNPSGAWRSIGMTVSRLDTPDLQLPESRAAYIFLFRDLTEIKRMERELRIRDRMSVLGEMAGSIAHEIRNPLGAISGSLQMLRNSNLRSDLPDGGDLVDIVIEESQRLSKTIDQFLEYARPGPFEPRQADLRELARETLALLRNSPEVSAAHRLEVEADAGAGDESYVAVVDAAQIKQVFWNLARNAIQAMPGGGTLSVRLRRVAEGIEVAFEDTGSGMTPEEIETIFQPYVSRSEGGTGLGLAVVYRILDRHGVRVEIDSEPANGTRFLLVFPEQAAEERERRLVLVADDEADGGRQGGPNDGGEPGGGPR